MNWRRPGRPLKSEERMEKHAKITKNMNHWESSFKSLKVTREMFPWGPINKVLNTLRIGESLRINWIPRLSLYVDELMAQGVYLDERKAQVVYKCRRAKGPEETDLRSSKICKFVINLLQINPKMSLEISLALRKNVGLLFFSDT